MIDPTQEQVDALTELLNIGVGRGATVLNTMLASHILLRVPYVRLMQASDLMEEIEKLGKDRLATVNLRFKGAFSGMVELVFPEKDASTLISAVTGEEPLADDLDTLRAGALCEVGNVVLNSVMGTISNMLSLGFTYSVPIFAEGNSVELWRQEDAGDETILLFARTFFQIEKFKIEGSIIVFLQIGALDTLLSAVDSYIASVSGN